MKQTHKIILGVALLLVIGFVYSAHQEGLFAGTFTNYDIPSREDNAIYYSFLSATSTSATSTNIVAGFDADGRYDDGSLTLAGAKKVTLYLDRASSPGANAGNSRFYIQVTPDGSDWYSFNKLLGEDISSTATSSPTLVGTSTQMYALDLSDDTFKAMRCVVVETTDGTHSCDAYVEY